MQCNFSTPTYSKQLILPIQFAPTKVRAHGLRDAHSYPLVSMGKAHHGQHSASFRVPAADAWGFPEIELRAGNSWPSIVLDVDGSNALYRIVEAVDKAEILSPNWTVTRKGSGGTHAVWNLARPVHRGESARKGPLAALARVSEFHADALRADSGYTAVLSHNPMASAHGPGFVTNWFHRAAYSLPELGEVIPFGWRRPTVSRTGVGRNCDLFQSLIRWAGCPQKVIHRVLFRSSPSETCSSCPFPHTPSHLGTPSLTLPDGKGTTHKFKIESGGEEGPPPRLKRPNHTRPSSPTSPSALADPSVRPPVKRIKAVSKQYHPAR